MNKLDPHSLARLDRKTKYKAQSKVLCGSCGQELAFVIQGPSYKDPHPVRILYLNYAWRLGAYGIYRLPPRAAKLAKEKGIAFAWPRHGKSLAKGVSTGAIDFLVVRDFKKEMPGDPDPPNLSETSMLMEAAPELPIKLECYNCQSVQFLDAEELGVEETVIGDSPNPEINNKTIGVIVRHLEDLDG